MKDIKKNFTKKLLELLKEFDADSVEFCAENDEMKLFIFDKGKLCTINLGYALEVTKKGYE